MFDRYVVLLTDLNPAQVKEALEGRSLQGAAGIRPIAALFNAESIDQDGFQLQLLGDRGNARPHLRGTVTARERGSKVAVSISHADAFSIVWSAGLVLAALVALGGIRTMADLPARLSIFAGAAAMLTVYWHLVRRLFETGALTAELALKDALNARAEPSDSKHGAPSAAAHLNRH